LGEPITHPSGNILRSSVEDGAKEAEEGFIAAEKRLKPVGRFPGRQRLTLLGKTRGKAAP